MDPTKSLPARAWSALRSNGLPLLIFFALGAAVLYGQQVLLAVTSYVNDVNPHAVAAKLPANMSSAEVTATKQAAGWMPAGLGSKFLFAAGYSFLFVALVWAAQGIAEKRGKAWITNAGAGAEYWPRPSYADQARDYRAGRWQLIALACAAIIASALIL